MSFRIEIYEIESPAGTDAKGRDVKRYEQVVDVIDIKKIIAAINSKPRGPRAKKGEKA